MTYSYQKELYQDRMMCNNHFPIEYIVRLKDQFGKIEVKYKKCENCGSYETEKDRFLSALVFNYTSIQNGIETTPIEKRWLLKELCDAQDKNVKNIKKLL